MIIPIGLERDTVRRLPWVSIVLIAINVVVFLTVGLGAGNQQEVAARRFQEMVAYWAQHAYLPFPERVLPRDLSARDRERIATMREVGKTVLNSGRADRGNVARERAELDRLANAFAAAHSADSYQKWGLVPANFGFLALFTCMFMHAGWLHLIGNMFIFYLSGPFVEDVFGRPLFLALYLISGVVASLTFVLVFPASRMPLVGASGAIAGIMGAFLLRFAREKIRFFYWLFFFVRGTFSAPAWIMLPLWLAMQVLMAMLVQSEGGVAYWAHVGGFACGFACAFIIRQTKLEERFIHPAIEKEISISQHPALDEGMALLSQGDLAGAREALHKVLEADPRHPDANLGLWQSFVQEGQTSVGVEFMVRVIDDELRRGERVLAFQHWSELLHDAGVPGPAGMRWRLASALEDSDRAGSIDVLRSLAVDPAADVLCEKANRKLEALGEVAPIPVFVPSRPVTAAIALPVEGDVPSAASPGPPLTTDVRTDVDAAAAAPAGARGFAVELCQVEGIREEGLDLRGEGGASELLPFFVIAHIVVAGIQAAPRPYLVLDLVLTLDSAGPRKVVRLPSTTFDPRRLLRQGDLPALQAFRRLVLAIASAAGAEVTPTSFAVQGAPVATFASIEAYEAELLGPNT